MGGMGIGEDGEQAEPSMYPAVTRDLFLEWRSPRFGRSNPERMNNAFWEWMIRTRSNAYVANRKLDGPDSTEAGPAWCFERFGQSSTFLPDGCEILIGGEHEDFYDADFYIYNDVVVQHPDGRLDIYGYPKEVFPPTDFHSATAVGEKIVLIGSLGYMKERKPGVTQVLSLELPTMTISELKTNGNPPGWISSHKAELVDQGRAIIASGGVVALKANDLIESIDDWKLSLVDWRWERLTQRRWLRWRIERKDKRLNSLWRVRSAIWESSIASMKDRFERTMQELTSQYGVPPDLEAAKNLYRLPVDHEVIAEQEGDDYRVKRVRVNGVVVRYAEGDHDVTMTVEGELERAIADALVIDLVEKLSTVENCEYEAVVIGE
jgi:hypothetical protein